MRYPDRVREVLEKEIVSGKLLPGDRLDEPTLARRFGISRTPVREALHQLAAVGLVEMRRARSPIVAAFTTQDLLDALEVMAQLEALCGRLAARRATEGNRDALERAHAAATSAAQAGNIDDYYRCDVAFHDELYRAARNRLLQEKLRALRNRFGPYRRRHFTWRGRIEQSREEHARIVAAILAGDPDESEAMTRAHVKMNGDVLADFLRGLEGPPIDLATDAEGDRMVRICPAA